MIDLRLTQICATAVYAEGRHFVRQGFRVVGALQCAQGTDHFLPTSQMCPASIGAEFAVT